ncbi:MAG: D-alanyl-D-alanine carboxypeptidase/D-alanyl-D-alanine-endopeptidase [Bacteroidota bacterium]
MLRIVFILYSFFFLIASANAQKSIEMAIDQLVKDPSLKHGSVSISVIDVESGQLLASHQPHQSLSPASSLKVVTTAMALKLLGPDYTFKTYLEYDGTIDETGVLKGNIFIRGGGDPTLGSHHFKAAKRKEEVLNLFVEAILKKGIRQIDGKIIGDASFFNTAVNGRTWLWEDLGNYYGAGAWGLNFHENLFFLDFRQKNQLGAQPDIEGVRPSIPNLLLINEVKLAKKGSGDNAYIFGAPYTYTYFVRGTIPVGNKKFTVKGAIPDPPFFMAHRLMEALAKAGIHTTQTASSLAQLAIEGVKTGDRKPLLLFESPKLSEIVKETNLKSVNLYCESMLRTIGKVRGGEGTAEKGLEIISQYLEEQNINTGGFFMEDGSGLSVRNAVSSYHLASFMCVVAKDKTVFPLFKASLPVASRTGSLKYMFKGSKAENRLVAKSGGMSRVRSYTGFVPRKSGGWMSFSVIVNEFSGLSGVIRNKMEQFMIALCQ